MRPDGLPLIGPMPGVQNAFEACVFTFGIAQGGGAGKVLAEWITAGRDRMGHVGRRSAPLTPITPITSYCERQGHRDLRPRIRDAFPASRMARRAGQEAVAGARPESRNLAASWAPITVGRRANWFAKPGDDTSVEATETWGRPDPGSRDPRRMRSGAGCLRRPGPARLFALLPARRGRGRLAARICAAASRKSAG